MDPGAGEEAIVSPGHVDGLRACLDIDTDVDDRFDSRGPCPLDDSLTVFVEFFKV